MQTVAQRGRLDRLAHIPIRIPTSKLEVGFYIAMLYSLTSDVWGISVPLLAGASMLGIAALCIWELGSCAKAVYVPTRLLFACAITYVLVQVVFHGEPITGESIRPFIIWILQLIIVCSLRLRPGFSRRYPLILFLIAVSSLPYLAFNPGTDRAAIDSELGLSGGLSGVNGLGEWFGFFAIYFAIYGLEAKRFTHRLGAWLLALGSLLVVGLTVSRGSMFGAVLGIAIAYRGALKRGFVPVLLLVSLMGVVYVGGLFDQTISHYKERGMNESGREKIWPAVVERILDSPVIGVGASNAGTYVPGDLVAGQPHNTFLYLALAAGIVPVALFITFFIQAGWRSAAHTQRREDESFRISYLVFTFVVVMLGDFGCMAPWGLLTLPVAAGSAVVYGKQRFTAIGVGNKVRFGRVSRHKPPDADTVAGS